MKYEVFLIFDTHLILTYTCIETFFFTILFFQEKFLILVNKFHINKNNDIKLIKL